MAESTLAEFKQRVRLAHAREFAIHRKVAVIAEREIVSRPRSHPDAVAVVLDMLIVQGYKAHLSTEFLGEHGFVEDMATMVRRLLELAVQSIYVGADSDEPVRAQRAADFLAFLWDAVPTVQKRKLPSELQAHWDDLAQPATDRRPNRSRWGPRFDQMFEYAEVMETYRSDYKLLSSLAHGSSGSLIIQYSQSPIPVHSVSQVGALLIYASRYYLVLLDHWMRLYAPDLYERFADVSSALRDWQATDDGG